MSNKNNIEIEIKFQLKKSDEDKFLSYIKKHGKKISESQQIDYYLDHKDRSFIFMAGQIKDAQDYLRVRVSANNKEICFKHWVRSSKNGQYTHCQEYETEVKDPDVALKIFQSLGYKPLITIDKKRDVYLVDIFEISVDKVKGCGSFFEIEIKDERLSAKNGLEKIYEFLRNIGISEIIKFSRGYVSILLNPDHDFGSRLAL